MKDLRVAAQAALKNGVANKANLIDALPVLVERQGGGLTAAIKCRQGSDKLPPELGVTAGDTLTVTGTINPARSRLPHLC